MPPWNELYRSGDYLKHWDYKFPTQELIGVVAALSLPRGSVAVDLGCGAGREAIFLAESGMHVHGVDVSDEALSIARQRATTALVSVEWHHCSVAQMPIKSSSVDFANDRGCFHHLHDDGRKAYASGLARILKHGARLLLRGCSDEATEHFIVVDEAAIDKFFDKSLFSRGPLFPITLISDAGTLPANLVVLTRI